MDQLLNKSLSEVLFSLGVVDQLSGVLDEHCSFGLSLHGIERAAVNGNPWLDHAVDVSLSASLDQESTEEGGVINTGAQDVDDSDVVDVEVGGGVGKTVDAGLGDEVAEEVSVVGDLR